MLVNGAGIVDTHTVEGVEIERWDEVFATNVRGTFLMCKHALPLLRESQGAIVNVAWWPGWSACPTAPPTAPPRAR